MSFIFLFFNVSLLLHDDFLFEYAFLVELNSFFFGVALPFLDFVL